MNEPPKERVKFIQTDLLLPYHYYAGDYKALYLHALKDKKILGSKCSETGRVFVPPVMSSPDAHAPCTEIVELPDKGIVTTFCVVNVPVYGRDIELPYVVASVALDGADVSIYGLVQECKAVDVEMGTRVQAVWKSDGERQGDHTDIKYFKPTGEAKAPLESFIHRL
jgi:uncharacterized protein